MSTDRVRLGIAGLVLGSLILLIPVLIAPVPPITDYPNHLARMWILAGGEQYVSQFYAVRFDTFTNIAIDLIALTVGKLAGYEFAGRLSIAAAVLLAPLGGALLWWSIHRRVHWWMLAFGLLAWNTGLIQGFLNFQIAVGLALVFAACEPWVEARPGLVKVVVRALLSLLLLLAHPFGLLFYALLLVAIAIGPTLSLRSLVGRDVALRVGLIALSVLIVAVGFVLLVPSLPGAQEHSNLGTLYHEVIQGFAKFRGNPKRKIADILYAIRAYSNVVDLATVLVFVVPVVLATVRSRLRVHAGLALLSVGLLIAYFLCPYYLLGASWVDSRFATMFFFASVAAVMPTLTLAESSIATAVLAIAFVGRTAVVGIIWHARQADVVSLAQALEPVPAGAAVLPLEMRPANPNNAPRGRYKVAQETSFRHLPALAVPWRHVFIPSLFAARGKQPVITLPPWDEISQPNGGMLDDVHALDAVVPVTAIDETAQYVSSWRTRFDYALVVDADQIDEFGTFVPPAGLTLIRDAGFARLYRINR